MHQRGLSELQDGASTQDTAPSSRLGRGASGYCSRPPKVAPFLAWLLLGALVVPGAWSFLSEEQEELLVELHNHYRGQVSPSASAMMPLKWDANLKLIAEGYAAKCVWNHNPDLEDTGENLFAGTGPLDLREALEKWFLEHLDFDFQNNSCDEDKMCGHYTQMVWADTHRVGCAFHLCNNMEGLEWERVSFLVCNYYPAGNYEGERPYVEGDWCSRCPENLQKCENNLCVADTEEEEEEEEDDVMTVVPPFATSDPSLQPEEEEEEKAEGKVVPPPTKPDSFLPPATTTISSFQDSEGRATHLLSTHPPLVPSTRQVEEEDMREEEERQEDDPKERETTDQQDRDRGKEVVRKYNRNIKVLASAGSASAAPLLLAWLTGILTLRL